MIFSDTAGLGGSGRFFGLVDADRFRLRLLLVESWRRRPANS